MGEVIQVSFGGVQAQFQGGPSGTFLTATVPMNALDGFVTATFPTGAQVQSEKQLEKKAVTANTTSIHRRRKFMAR